METLETVFVYLATINFWYLLGAIVFGFAGKYLVITDAYRTHGRILDQGAIVKAMEDALHRTAGKPGTPNYSSIVRQAEVIKLKYGFTVWCMEYTYKGAIICLFLAFIHRFTHG